MKTLNKFKEIMNTTVSWNAIYVMLVITLIGLYLLTSCQSASGHKAEELAEKALDRQINSRNYDVVHYNPEIYTIVNDSIVTVRSGTRKIVYKLNKDDKRYYLCE